jgi:hypothetical protein
MTELIRTAFLQQAHWCRELGSPFTGLLMEQVGLNLDRSTTVGRRVLDWPGKADARFDAVPLRLAGGLNALVRRGALPGLAGLYPPHPLPDGAALWAAVGPALAHPALDAWLDSAPQTNEVARSAALMAGLMAAVGESGLPVALFELGSSAGLNLVLDRYSYDLGGVAAGQPRAALHLAPEWRGVPPVFAPVTVARRRGVDLNPLDVTNPADQERLLAYIWPDQAARLARITAAIAIATGNAPKVDRADAASWVERQVRPTPGVLTVVMHSIAFQYFPPATQRRIIAHLAAAGATATAHAPLAWLRFEVDQRFGTLPSVLLTQWPGGIEHRLGQGSAHGIWVEWFDASRAG